MPEGVASVVELDDIFFILIDLLLRGFVLDLELVGSFDQFAQFLGDGREVGVVWQISAKVGHIGDAKRINGDRRW